MQKTFSYNGLSDAEAIKSREKYGTNILTPPPKVSLWKLFLEKFDDPIVRILIIAACLSLIITIVEKTTTGKGNFAETIGIFTAIVITTGVAFWFEMDANKEFELLNKINDDVLTKVIRNGQIAEIRKTDIVIGDIILIETGEEIPADGVLIESSSLQVDESCLTGELLIDKTEEERLFDENATYPSNEVFRGTKVLSGHGIIRVVQVGDHTEYGKLAKKSTEIIGGPTPLNRQLEHLARLIGAVGLILAVIIFVILFAQDIVANANDYSPRQLLFIAILLFSAIVALTNMWLPILYKGLAFLGIGVKNPDFISKKDWRFWAIASSIIIVISSGLTILIGLSPFEAQSWISINTAQRILRFFMISVTLIVVAVPEGLPMSITLSLALSMRRMLKTNNLVRKMHACETMGAVTVICTDKTGTLTQNKMKVFDVKFPLPDGNKLDATLQNERSFIIAQGISINSTAHLSKSNDNNSISEEGISAIGNPTESALLLWLNDQNIDYMSLRQNSTVISQLPFSTERKFMATLVHQDKRADLADKAILYVKGAPEIILPLCKDTLLYNDELDKDDFKNNINAVLLRYQEKALRTLGFAYKYINLSELGKDLTPEGLEKLANDMTFIGIAAISDPIREEVPQSINECLNAGINIKIITGDTHATAKEIARQIGVWKKTDSEKNIITGPEFASLSDKEALIRIRELKIMCRARPTDKQRLVQLLKSVGEIVAVTGDGTNDAPALNYADVGLSMGSGTAVAKEASEITLLDDSFSSITTAVMWGRSLYQNIQRFILFQLVISVTAMILVFLGTLFGFELPLTVTQMLWLNLIMDTFAAGALATLPPSKAVLKEKPRKNSDFIISRSMRRIILTTSSFFVVILLGLLYILNNPDLSSFLFYNAGVNKIEYGMSFFFTFFVFLQFWNLFNAKAFKTTHSAFAGIKSNKSFIIVLIAIALGQFLIVTFGGDVFRTTPLRLSDWCIIIGITSLVFWVGEITRRMKKIG